MPEVESRIRRAIVERMTRERLGPMAFGEVDLDALAEEIAEALAVVHPLEALQRMQRGEATITESRAMRTTDGRATIVETVEDTIGTLRRSIETGATVTGSMEERMHFVFGCLTAFVPKAFHDELWSLIRGEVSG